MRPCRRSRRCRCAAGGSRRRASTWGCLLRLARHCGAWRTGTDVGWRHCTSTCCCARVIQRPRSPVGIPARAQLARRRAGLCVLVDEPGRLFASPRNPEDGVELLAGAPNAGRHLMTPALADLHCERRRLNSAQALRDSASRGRTHRPPRRSDASCFPDRSVVVPAPAVPWIGLGQRRVEFACVDDTDGVFRGRYLAHDSVRHDMPCHDTPGAQWDSRDAS
jgi:hypothetical protein